METKVNLCAKIPKELHNKIKNGQAETELNLNEYVEKILTEYYQLKENGVTKMSKQRTLAVQIDENLFDRLDEHIKKSGLKKKEFLIDLIEKTLVNESDNSAESESNS